MDKAKALTLPELLGTVPSDAHLTITNEDKREVHIIHVGRHCHNAAAELRRLHAENERLSATVKAREDEILTHSEAFYEATRLLSEERKKNERLAAALAASCDEARDQMWESGGVAGCSRALSAEFQRDALLAEHQQTLALQQRSYEREIQLEVEAEREACARVCEHQPHWVSCAARRHSAAAIRARGNK